jgi:hypothetical protein
VIAARGAAVEGGGGDRALLVLQREDALLDGVARPPAGRS